MTYSTGLGAGEAAHLVLPVQDQYKGCGLKNQEMEIKMGTSLLKNPITKKELEKFRDSLKIGDKLMYVEDMPRDDGVKGRTQIKRVMEVEKVYKYTIDLKKGALKRNVTIQEALIHNVKRPNPQSQESIQDRRKLILNLTYRGISRAEIAQRTGYSQRAVSNIQRAGMETRGKIKERNEKIAALRANGEKINSIAQIVGCSHSTVSCVLKNMEGK